MTTPLAPMPMSERLRIDYQWTPRQREVLGLIERGKSNLEIADALGISRDGVKYHVSEILSKLGAESREEAAEYWRRYNGVAPRFARVFRAVAGGTVAKVVAGVAAVGVAGVAIAVAVAAFNGEDASTDTTLRVASVQEVGLLSEGLALVVNIDVESDSDWTARFREFTLVLEDGTEVPGTTFETWANDPDSIARVIVPAGASRLKVGFQLPGEWAEPTALIPPEGFEVLVLPKAVRLASDTPTALSGPPQERWQYHAAPSGYVRAAASSEVVFAVSGHDYADPPEGSVALLERDTGKERWKSDVDCAPTYPAVDAERAYFPCTDGTIRAFDLKTGNEAWRKSPGGAPVFLIASGGLVFAADGDADERYDLTGVDPPVTPDGRVRAFNAATGALEWEVETKSYTSFIVLDGDRIHASTSDTNAGGEVLVMKARSGDIVWRTQFGSASSRPFVAGDAVYAAARNGELSRFDASDGKRQWTTEVQGGGVFESPVVIDDVVVAGSNANSLFRLSAADGSVLGKTEYCDCPYGGARFGDGVLIFGSGLAVLDPDTLTPVFSYVPQGQVGLAVVADGWIFAPTTTNRSNATLIAFR